MFSFLAPDSWPLTPSLLLICALALGGCNKADVEPSQAKFKTEIAILEPAYAMRRAADPPWYSNMQVLLDDKPLDEKDLETRINAGRDEVKKNVEELLQEISVIIEQERKGGDKWSVVAVSCGRGKKPNEIHFEAEVGLTKLFERRPSIAFSNVRLELCIAKLSRETEIQDSQPKGRNPAITWEKQNISAHEAMETLLNVNGFDYKFVDTSFNVAFKAQDFASRKEFVEAVKEAILSKGKSLNTLRPALIVSPKVKPEPPKDETDTKTKTGTSVKTTTDTKTDAKPVTGANAPPPPAPEKP